MRFQGDGWFASVWRWATIIKAVVKSVWVNDTSDQKNTQRALISPDKQQHRYLIVMMNEHDKRMGVADAPVPVQPQSQTPEPLAQMQPAVRPMARPVPTRESTSSTWWAVGLLMAVVLALLLMALLWHYPAFVQSIFMGGATVAAIGVKEPVVERGYGVTPVMHKMQSDVAFRDAGKRMHWRKVEAARGYLRGTKVAPFLKHAQRNWRHKLYRVQVSNEGSEEEQHDLTMALPYENLKIVPNQGLGDCLFLCWQRMLAEQGVGESVSSLRRVVADSLTEEKFDFLKGIYDSAVKEGEHSLVSDYRFMHNLGSVDGLRNKVMDSSYYGDEMALTALEKRFNLRCVVLLLVNNARISLARRFVDEEGPKPRYAILLLDQSMLHYELVEYFDQAVMKETELPEKIQSLLSDQETEKRGDDSGRKPQQRQRRTATMV